MLTSTQHLATEQRHFVFGSAIVFCQNTRPEHSFTAVQAASEYFARLRRNNVSGAALIGIEKAVS